MVALPPYEKYRQNAAMETEYPESWKVTRLRYVCRLSYGESLPDSERKGSNYAVFGSNGVVGRDARSNTHGPALVIGRKGSFGKIRFSAEPVFAIDTTYYVDERGTGSNLRWLFYALSTLGLDQVSRDSAIPGLDREEAYDRLLSVPPLPEQQAVADFLDVADARISRYIAAKRRMIALLEEQKQAIINQAVTCGLDPDVPLKPSGVDWLGDIPAHWEVAPLRRRLRLQGGYAFPSHMFATDGVPVVRMSNLKSGIVDVTDAVRIGTEQCLKEFAIRRGDVLIGMSGSLSNFAVVSGDDLPLQLNQRVGRFVIYDSFLHSDFLSLMIQSDAFKTQMQLLAGGTAQLNISSDQVGSIQMAIPTEGDQYRIVSEVAQLERQANITTGRVEREIILVGEYRTRLISDVVTGKLDVRGAELPALEDVIDADLEAAEVADLLPDDDLGEMDSDV